MIDLQLFAQRHRLPWDGKAIELAGGRITPAADCLAFVTGEGGDECRRLKQERWATVLFRAGRSWTITFPQHRLAAVLAILEGNGS